jgi:hypothetical protein
VERQREQRQHTRAPYAEAGQGDLVLNFQGGARAVPVRVAPLAHTLQDTTPTERAERQPWLRRGGYARALRWQDGMKQSTCTREGHAYASMRLAGRRETSGGRCSLSSPQSIEPCDQLVSR